MLKQFADKVIKDRKKFSETKRRFLKTMHSIQGEMNRDDMSKCYHKRVEVVHEHDIAQFEKRRDKTHKSIYDTERKYFDFLCENNIEIWKPVKGFPNYEASTLGRLKIVSSKKLARGDIGMIMKQHISGGYYTVCVHNNEVHDTSRVHRLVATTFVMNVDPKRNVVIDHIDNNKLNNKVTNLRWVTQSQNMQNHHNNFRVYKNKEIIQCNLKGIPIKEWNNINEVLENNKQMKYGYLLDRIAKYKIAYGFLWKRKHEVDNELHDDEVFKNIGIMGDYDFSKFELSNHGKIRKASTKRFLKNTTFDNGYSYAHLMSMKMQLITITVHRLVAHTFVELNRDLTKAVNHIDKQKSNNYYKNLEWISIQENTIHGIGKKVNQLNIDTEEIIATYNCISDAYRALGKKKCNSHISRCCAGKEETVLGYKWQYVKE